MKTEVPRKKDNTGTQIVTQVYEYGKKVMEFNNTEFKKAIDTLKSVEEKYK